MASESLSQLMHQWSLTSSTYDFVFPHHESNPTSELTPPIYTKSLLNPTHKTSEHSSLRTAAVGSLHLQPLTPREVQDLKISSSKKRIFVHHPPASKKPTNSMRSYRYQKRRKPRLGLVHDSPPDKKGNGISGMELKDRTKDLAWLLSEGSKNSFRLNIRLDGPKSTREKGKTVIPEEFSRPMLYSATPSP